MSVPDIPKMSYINQSHLDAIDTSIEELEQIEDVWAGPDDEKEILVFYAITIARLRELRAFTRSRLGTMLVDIDQDKGDPWATPTN